MSKEQREGRVMVAKGLGVAFVKVLGRVASAVGYVMIWPLLAMTKSNEEKK